MVAEHCYSFSIGYQSPVKRHDPPLAPMHSGRLFGVKAPCAHVAIFIMQTVHWPLFLSVDRDRGVDRAVLVDATLHGLLSVDEQRLRDLLSCVHGCLPA